MTTERYQTVKTAFRLALDLPVNRRDTFLQEFCGQDLDLLSQVLTLLASDAQPTTPIDSPTVGTQFRLRSISLSYTATLH